MKLSNSPGGTPMPPAKLQFACLAAASSIVFLFTILGGYKMIAYYYSNSFLMIPALIFLGINLTQPLSVDGRRKLGLGVLMAVWYGIVKSIHRLQGMDAMSCSMFLCMYLLAWPYAAVTRDGEQQKGLTLAAEMFGVAAFITALYGVLTVTGHVPAYLERYIGFDGGRLSILTHPNMTACVYLIGAAFCIGGAYRVKKRWQKAALLLAAALEYILIALTNSRTTVFAGCVMLGGIVFFAILRSGICFAIKKKGGWLRIAGAAVLAVIVICGTFLASTKLYERNYDRLVKQYAAKQEASSAEALSEEQLAQIRLPGTYGQGETLAGDMKTLNGRTAIWKASFDAIRADPQILLWGTGYADNAITASSTWSYIKHSHNSWIEILLKMGIPGLAVALVITWTGVKKSLLMLFKSRDMWKICIALLVPCLMVCGFLEPYYFNGYPDYHMIEFIFFLLVGYLSQWEAECAV